MSDATNTVPGRPSLLLLVIAVSFLGACGTIGRVENRSLEHSASGTRGYSVLRALRRLDPEGITFVVAFSGGGTRAAALSYGVLRALRDVEVEVGGRRVRLLDEVDVITAVSGGSFTAAYYGLHGERTFDDFERRFLRRDVAHELIAGVVNPLSWFSTTGRTDRAARLFSKTLFDGATFAELEARGGPLVIVNATDLARGVRFSFVQEYFDLVCSDLSSFPVGRAVMASAAVPFFFHPVVLGNHGGCTHDPPALLRAVERSRSTALRETAAGLSSYLDKAARPYVHLVDGGLSDNLGLRAMLDIVALAGGSRQLFELAGVESRTPPARHFLLVVVDASTQADYGIDATARSPSLEQTANAVTDIQLHRYSQETLDSTRAAIARWAEEASTEERRVHAHFVHLDLQHLRPEERRRRANGIPTSFSLSEDDVDLLIQAGGDLLRENPDFGTFLRQVGAPFPP